MRILLQPQKWSIGVIVFCVCAVISIGILGYRYLHPETRTFMDGLRSCASTTRGYDALNSCTRTLVRSELDTHTPEELLLEVGSSEIPKRWGGDCHSIGHAIGQETYDKYKDLEHSLSLCSNQCFSGCLHGAFGEAMIEKLGITDPDADF